MTSWLTFQKNVAQAFPAVSTYLNGQAHEGAITALEQRFGHALPQTVRDIYEEHDGEAASSTGNVFGLRFLPIQSIVEELDAWREIVRGGLEDLNDDCTSKPKGAIQCVYANEKWLPLFSDGGGNYIGLDFDPGPKGTFGQVINFGRDEGGKHVLAKDLNKFLVQLAQLVGWPVIEGNEHGGFSVNGMHFIDAIKNIKNLPSKNPDHGYYSVWVCPGHKNTIPIGYLEHDKHDGNGRSFFDDFGVIWKEDYAASTSNLVSGEPEPLADMFKHQNHAKKYLLALQEDAAKLGIASVSLAYVIQDYCYTPLEQMPGDACLTFVGCYKIA